MAAICETNTEFRYDLNGNMTCRPAAAAASWLALVHPRLQRPGLALLPSTTASAARWLSLAHPRLQRPGPAGQPARGQERGAAGSRCTCCFAGALTPPRPPPGDFIPRTPEDEHYSRINGWFAEQSRGAAVVMQVGGDVRTDLGTSRQTDFGYTGPREIGSRKARKGAKGMEDGEGSPHAVKSVARPGRGVLVVLRGR